MKSKGHLYIYIHQVFNKIKSKFLSSDKSLLHHTEGELQNLGTIIIIGLRRLEKSYKETVMGGIIGAIN
jgi:uncharacterized protein YsxB (DUF464 family)